MTSSCLFILHVFSKHSVSSHVTSNRGLEFVSNFFHSLDTALNMWFYFTSGYHLKGNKQTKCMNQILEQYLCIYCNYQQDNWSELLPLVEFAYNNALSATTSISLFFTNESLMSYRVLSKLKSLWPNSIIRNPLIHNISPFLISK